MTGKFIALEGIDGAGKTTLAREISDLSYPDLFAVEAVPEFRLPADPDGRYLFISRRQESLTSEYSAKLMKQAATMLWYSGDSTDLPPSFWVTLQASWFTAHSETVLRPALEAGYNVIVDGWFYKFWSKLLAQGYRLEQLETIFDGVRIPDVVVLMETDVGSVFDRRSTFQPRELGMHAGYSRLSRETFIEYQERGLANLREFGSRWNWRRFDLPPGEEVDVSAKRLRSVLQADPTSVDVPDAVL
ncbi:hypothetical protein OIE69_42460 [Actinacidiphila glaucinigra]|uniref:dTMP kinase n=1 Tax=Actinacidiphila glaucinigra TaxID=235986 RepID=UPI002DD92819|nr:hypothetical protein [Actinacidiphila glaucinigra]WSD65065.1 hypothetical protein OIE69_42460 [Actinacidiphila glaucinigra]